MSLAARGTIGKALTASAWKGVAYMRVRVVPKLSMIATSVAIRAVIKDASQAWKTGATIGSTTINASYKAAFDAVAVGQAFSGFNLFMQNCVAINYDKDVSPYYDGSLVLPTDPTDIGA